MFLETDPSRIALTVSFDGLSFGETADTYCVAGAFDFHLGGTIEGVLFSDGHLIASGTERVFVPSGSCPTH